MAIFNVFTGICNISEVSSLCEFHITVLHIEFKQLQIYLVNKDIRHLYRVTAFTYSKSGGT
jgi:hypothetical protein